MMFLVAGAILQAHLSESRDKCRYYVTEDIYTGMASHLGTSFVFDRLRQLRIVVAVVYMRSTIQILTLTGYMRLEVIA